MQSNGTFVPKRFKNIVALHIIKNLVEIQDVRMPLILGIHGASGEGKTFQCELVLRELDVAIIRIAAKDFESEKAGEPSELLCEQYWEASELIETQRASMVALFINDLDTGIGHWGGDVQYTVNTQIVLATLMDIADYPEYVGGRPTERIPIIVTGNDFTKLYKPLTRAGRMDTYSWIPTLTEKTDIVRHNIFPMPSLTDADVANLVKTFKQMPVAFFSLLKSRLLDSHFLQQIESQGFSQTVELVKSRYGNDICMPEFNLELLMEKAHELAGDKMVNHLARK
jgi:AAA+ superfamily predicted ATPase